MTNQKYINLLKNVLTDYHRIEEVEYKTIANVITNRYVRNFFGLFNIILHPLNLEVLWRHKTSAYLRLNGLDWPAKAETMVGLKRLENIEICINDILVNKVEGDFIETGVWRGGAVIFMKALLKTFGVEDRRVFVADSFEGLPKPDIDKYFHDIGDKHHQWNALSIGEEIVRNNFIKYDLLDDNVVFLKGWFKDTLKIAPIEKLSLIRLDGDMYESTMDALIPLYPKLSVGGYIIVDDYNAVAGCKAAIMDYRKIHNITDEIISIDTLAVYWKKSV